jgi:hypothetical protein
MLDMIILFSLKHDKRVAKLKYRKKYSSNWRCSHAALCSFQLPASRAGGSISSVELRRIISIYRDRERVSCGKQKGRSRTPDGEGDGGAPGEDGHLADAI